MTDAELVNLMNNPPKALAPLAAMFRNLRGAIQQKDIDIAVAAEAARAAKAKCKRLRSDRDKMAAQADALSVAFKALCEQAPLAG